MHYKYRRCIILVLMIVDRAFFHPLEQKRTESRACRSRTRGSPGSSNCQSLLSHNYTTISPYSSSTTDTAYIILCAAINWPLSSWIHLCLRFTLAQTPHQTPSANPKPDTTRFCSLASSLRMLLDYGGYLFQASRVWSIESLNRQNTLLYQNRLATHLSHTHPHIDTPRTAYTASIILHLLHHHPQKSPPPYPRNDLT